MKQLKCEICQEIIAQFDPVEVTVPISGKMFKSADPAHNPADPFPGDPSWEWIKCPHCHNQPYIIDVEKEPKGPRWLMTPDGLWGIEVMSTRLVPDGRKVFAAQPDEETYRCEVCGRKFTKRMALVGHMRVHGGKKNGS